MQRADLYRLTVLLMVVVAPGVCTGTGKGKRPSRRSYRRVCYYTNWSQYRWGPGKFTPDNIDPSLCTHIIYAFAKLSENQLNLTEWDDKSMISTINGLKNNATGLKTLISVGGWSAGTEEFSAMAASSANRTQFAQSAIKFMRTLGFDGLDLDWEYPNKLGNRTEEKTNFALLVNELRTAFIIESVKSKRPSLILSAAVSGEKKQIERGYDVRALSRDLDFINLMTYDLHGSWEQTTGENAPLFYRACENSTERTLNVNFAAAYWVKLGAPRRKLNIGMAAYGRSFTLAAPNSTGIGARTNGPGLAGPHTNQAGFLAYYEICEVGDTGGSRHWDPQQRVPYLVKGNLWVGYDDISSIFFKVQWLVNQGYGGAMLWSLDLDDFAAVCISSAGRKFPLLTAISSLLLRAEKNGSDRQVSLQSDLDEIMRTQDHMSTSEMVIG